MLSTRNSRTSHTLRGTGALRFTVSDASEGYYRYYR